MPIADLLVIEHLSAGGNDGIALTDISLAVEDGTALALMGRKGAGKTALLESIIGLRPLRGGRMTLAARDITGWPAEERAAAGIGWVPQGRPIFRSLSVEENIAAVMRKGEWTLERIYGVFPMLRERRHSKGVTLSLVEQRMLAVGRALAINPLILLLDELFEGLPPAVTAELSTALRGILHEGIAAIIAEPKAEHVLPLSTQAIILEGGTIAYQGSGESLAHDAAMLEESLERS